MKYLVSGNAPVLYPVETFFGLLHCVDGKTLEIPFRYPLYGEWGCPVSNVYDFVEDMSVPDRINVVYLSIVERKFYSLNEEIVKDSQDRMQEALAAHDGEDMHMVVGLAPYGLVSLWISTPVKRYFICSYNAKDASVPMKCFRAATPDVTVDEVCDDYLTRLRVVRDNQLRYGLPSKDLYPKLMQQYRYRYVIEFRKWNGDNECWEEYEEAQELDKPVLCRVEDHLTDGAFDKLNDGGLFKYHFGGKPQKLHLKWEIGKAEYDAYLWFDDSRLVTLFGKFYGIHRETNADLMINIDVTKSRYEVALFRYGLQEPVVIPENAYQLIVFKNKFEYHRSENYDKPKGAWVW